MATWKIQNGSFGTLSEPEWSQKKCSGELRSRSIDWWGQMVHRAKIKIGKKVPGSRTDQKLTLGFSGVWLSKHGFLWFWTGFGLRKLDFCSWNIFLSKFWLILASLNFCNFLVFVFAIFQFGRFSGIIDFDQICSTSGCHPIRKQYKPAIRSNKIQ